MLAFLSLSLYAEENYEEKLNLALDKRIYEDQTWKSLLHLYHNRPDIKDPSFYINGQFSNAKDEFISSFHAFFLNPDQKIKCRFPARFFWMQKKLNLTFSKLGNCSEVEEFVKNAPVDKVAVVFASENISMPTSMMGHIFLKLSGKNEKGQDVEHAISFFTNVDGVSFPTLVFKTLLVGMKGYYTLTPYHAQKNTYLYNDQRNVWEYQLKMNEDEKKLLQFHLYELKHISFIYYFHRFNCATLISNLLSVPFPEVKEDRSMWVTPLDVIRTIHQKNLVEEIAVIPSSKWKIKSLLESVSVDSNNIAAIKSKKYREIEISFYSKEDQYLIWELARGYNNYLYEEEKISREEWREANQFLVGEKEKLFQNVTLDSSEYKKPHLTIRNSQVSLGYIKRKDEKIIALGFLPVSHELQDDTSQYSNESELKLGKFVLGYETTKKRFKVDSINIYSASIFRPSDPLIGGWSGRFDVGYGSQLGKQFQVDHVYYAEGGIGKTYGLHRDIDFFGLANAGVRSNYSWIYAGPEVGLIIREFFGMKSLFSYEKEFSNRKDLSGVDKLKLTQALNLPGYALDISWKGLYHESHAINEYAVFLKRLF